MFIQTETTPNPSTLKFLPGRQVLPSGTLEIRDPHAAEKSPLARRLFAIDGVSSIFFAQDFITVTKSGGEWPHMKPALLGAIMEYFLSGDPLFDHEGEAETLTAEAEGEEFFEASDRATVDTIKELLETRIRPAVAGDGGDIVFRGFRDGIVYLAMKGSCSGCPSSTATLKNGVQNLLRHFLPDVREVQAL